MKAIQNPIMDLWKCGISGLLPKPTQSFNIISSLCAQRIRQRLTFINPFATCLLMASSFFRQFRDFALRNIIEKRVDSTVSICQCLFAKTAENFCNAKKVMGSTCRPVMNEGFLVVCATDTNTDAHDCDIHVT